MLKKMSLFTGCVLSTLLMANSSWAGGDAMYKITIYNLTRGQPLAPVMAATHKPGISFFELGTEPSDELAMLAEAGNGQPMADYLAGMPGVRDTEISTDGLTFPGHSTTVMVSARRFWDNVSVAAMLGATNDAFFAIKDLPLPKGYKPVVYMADAYDSGSETNDELASTVAGLGGEGYSPEDSGEGFVHIHAGIHGIGDADASALDWRNPVAKIVIERVAH